MNDHGGGLLPHHAVGSSLFKWLCTWLRAGIQQPVKHDFKYPQTSTTGFPGIPSKPVPLLPLPILGG